MLHVYRAGLLVWGFYLMGLGCKKKGGGGCWIGVLLMEMTIT